VSEETNEVGTFDFAGVHLEVLAFRAVTDNEESRFVIGLSQNLRRPEQRFELLLLGQPTDVADEFGVRRQREFLEELRPGDGRLRWN
jgi:hypothetical protein